MRGRLLGFIGAVVILAALSVTPVAVQAAGLTYEGSSTIGENVMPELAKAFEAKEKIKFNSIGLLGSGKGFKAAMEGKADIGGVSRPLSTEEKKKKPYYQVIAYDAIAVFINEKNTVRELSKEQLKGIFSGKITNWKQVGGRDAGIVVVTEVKSGERATLKEFRELAMDGADFGPSKEFDKPHDCVKNVAADENAITNGTIAFKMAGVKAVGINKVEPSPQNIRSGAYLLGRPLVLVSRELPKGDLSKFYEFVLSAEGQAIVGKTFVPVRQ